MNEINGQKAKTRKQEQKIEATPRIRNYLGFEFDRNQRWLGAGKGVWQESDEQPASIGSNQCTSRGVHLGLQCTRVRAQFGGL